MKKQKEKKIKCCENKKCNKGKNNTRKILIFKNNDGNNKKFCCIECFRKVHNLPQYCQNPNCDKGENGNLKKLEKRYQDKYCSRHCININRKHSKQIKLKKSKSRKKYYEINDVWNKGLTKETDKRVNNISLGLKKSNKFQKIMRSEEHKNKMSFISSGINNGFYGKKHTKESKEKMSNTRAIKIANGSIIIKKGCIKGWYFSDKMDEDFYYDSFWELLRMKILDLDKNVVSWTKRHGIRIPYKINDIIKNYVPDFLITYKDKTILEEVKGSSEEIRNIKFKALRKYCKKNNINHSIIEFEDLEELCFKYFNNSIKNLRENFKNK
jgi:hypothetical protein